MKKFLWIYYNIDSLFLMLVAVAMLFLEVITTRPYLRGNLFWLFLYVFSPLLVFLFLNFIFISKRSTKTKQAFSIVAIIYSLFSLFSTVVLALTSYWLSYSEYCRTTFYECFVTDGLVTMIIAIVMAFFSLKNIILALTWKKIFNNKILSTD